MKILMPVLHYYPVIGGLETWTQNIAERLAQKAKVFVVTGKVKDVREDVRDNFPNTPFPNTPNIIRTSLFSLKDLSHSSWFYILTALPFIFFKSRKIIKKQKIVLLHCQGFLSSLLGYLVYKILKIPYISTVQRLEQKTWLKKLVYNNAKSCIGASSAVSKYFREIGCKNIKVIPNGIDLQRFENLNRRKSREKLGLKNEFAIITVARLEKVKGIAYLIKAFEALINFQFSIFNFQSNPNFQLLIIGDGSERKFLEDLVNKLNLQDKVKFLGQIPNEKIPEYLAGADCFCLPSLREGFGISILEAQAAGAPVIASNIGGILDLVEQGKTGILVEPKNSKAIAESIVKIFSQPDFKQNLVENARANLEKYNWQNIAEKVYKIYQSILGEDFLKRENLDILKKRALGKQGLILAYHGVESKEAKTSKIVRYNSREYDIGELCVSDFLFEKQLDFLRKKGYYSISLKDLLLPEQAEKKQPQKGIAITFDDGFRNFFTIAGPILLKYGFLATVFLVADKIGKPGFLSWDEIFQLKKQGFSFGAHTLSHPMLTQLPLEQANLEIKRSKQIIEEKLGGLVEFFSYPYGDFNPEIQNLVKNAGFLGAVITPSFSGVKQGPYSLKRIGINKGNSMFVFKLKVNGIFAWLRENKLLWKILKKVKPSK